jgi:aspartate/methionine/tyrosine aminotransferase
MVNSNSCTASFTQWAGIAALQGDQMPVRQMVGEFKRRRDLIVSGLNDLPGVTCRTPKGAFYVFPNIKALKRPSSEVAEAILKEGGVAVLGGTAFGQYGEGYLRLSYANSETNIRKAFDWMRPVLSRFAG